MMHIYRYKGVNIAVDEFSGGIHVLDEITYEILKEYDGYQGKAPLEDLTLEKVLPKLEGRYSPAEVMEALEEIKTLIAEGQLFSEDKFKENYKPPKTEIKAMCLNIAHDCNMRCRYCFAGTGSYGHERGLMPLTIAQKAIDFLIENSGYRKNLEVDFFGGEPLLNWEVVKATVLYGKAKAKAFGKNISFTLTTNALLLTDEVREFLAEHDMGIVLSLDGREEVHDRMRPLPGGKASYQTVLTNIKNFLEKWGDRPYYIRGTFTAQNPDFAEDFKALAQEGFKSISLEPVVLPDSSPLALREELLPVLKAQYDELGEYLYKLWQEGKNVEFFHFNLNPYEGPCLHKRLSGCGAGFEYIAVSPEGDIYPCHQFVGKDEYRMGNVEEGIVRKDIPETFKNAHIYNKTECATCWARYYCSGGCHANNLNMTGSLLKPYKTSCEMMRKRVEIALYLTLKKEGLI
ncbi:thioether cross-link-forming SCIFF peptide maturase [Carboxydothermus hydrogenoformans]|uniref:Radical SAM domain protein n=1 Tax=Carboxydothermus hydrogenoformans (strain ATCC BAA-161 / DSM 6008 / Z-2901) TaxID=246194 RepID=Q3A8W4_CARHZ|nr:thioether cross-link-forming SCIFF peptide maturase [Carboxydothermus hydrogenoformans]ABB15497.1 radical SAM domain protein [Carboxydothermus hydrogenoformans Z-2901]